MRFAVKAGLLAGCFAAAIAGFLFLETKLSDSYALATARMPDAPELRQAIGEFQSSLLIGSSHRLVPGGISCAELTFLVKSSSGIHTVLVLERKRDFHKSWEIYDMPVGWGASSDKYCREVN